ncbi:WXG100 family type VII secretion target [Aeromicrobium sp. YIM 150415]|uniref:WXG100 family type VII secretion target n=1 Tax=Aeromicrobium piscarium TaxID=2590901 RepID=A0A554SGR0_9ACTN|nr:MULTISPECIES: WXG100 family type VII secretion target [Aeromicrobium]MBM9462885.1 WXG100 family type VII secretion target [Aeromicrobium sp. YIM 150415]OUZ11306.1 hypothetical protein BHE97_05585 [Aeromicrobium sp. PE09-221]TSD65537.1 hypothetical protein FNM00_03675 [Aeromicrobium piscarium]
MAGARIEDLHALYTTLQRSMQETDTMITNVDASLTQANEEWQSAGAAQFNESWVQFKQTLTNLCQAFAGAGTDVAFQHNKFAEGAKEQDKHPVLSPLTSPR